MITFKMPSHFAGRQRHDDRGFTLIEILIVMIIISIVSSIAVLSIHSNPAKQYETLSKQLVNLIQLAEQEAMLRPATIGIKFNENDFQFYQFDAEKNRWFPIQKGVLKLHRLPSNTHITVKIHDEAVAMSDQMQLIIPPSNDLTPFVITIGKAGETPYDQVIGEASGEVRSEKFNSE